ncbi:MAG: hypothetical protein U1C53_00600 [Candidatus Veblenbacteria bacterium]|nr:hypothetical protein [Candidatus Veblenbacteria bacterium]
MQHVDLAAGRWQQMSVVEQFANIGSEVGRALAAHQQGNKARAESALIRAFELFDLTLASKSLRLPARQETARARELVADWFYGGNSYHTSVESWNGYFNQFAMAANTKR